MSPEPSLSSRSPVGPFASLPRVRVLLWLLLAAVALAWWQCSRWVAQRQTLTAAWYGKTLILSTEDDDAPYVVTHLISGRYREMAALKEPLAINVRATLTQEQIDRLTWRETNDGTECNEAFGCRDFKAGDKVAPPRPGSLIRAIYYRAKISE